MKNFNIYNIGLPYINQLVFLEQECFSIPWSYKSFLESFNNSQTSFYGAVVSGKLIGYIGLYNILGEGYITNICVLKEYRNLGIASALLQKVIDYSIKNKMVFLTLEVRKSNINAIKLYEKFGFEINGLRTNFYQNPLEDAWVYTLKIII